MGFSCDGPAAGRERAQKHQITKVLDRARLYPGEMCVYPRCDVAWREQSSTVDDPDKRIISL